MSIKTKKLFDQIHRAYLTPSEDKVLKELSTYGDWNSGSYIRASISTIARNTKYHERTIYRAMKKLRGLMVIRRVRPHSRLRRLPSEYTINFQTVHFLIADSVNLFALDRKGERARLLRKEDRRLERFNTQFGIGHLADRSESLNNIEKYRKNWNAPSNTRSVNDQSQSSLDNLKLHRENWKPSGDISPLNESSERLKKYRENWSMTPDKMSGYNVVIDTIIDPEVRESVESLLFTPPIRPPI